MDHLPLGSSSVVRSSPLAASPSMRSISRVALSIFIIRLLAHRDPASCGKLVSVDQCLVSEVQCAARCNCVGFECSELRFLLIVQQSFEVSIDSSFAGFC